uniref:Uncharacterized protein n=1 Tax=Scytonema sp. PCC 10023 TaxID=1680591 RepID=A0A0K0PD78_9CYAN|nr:hypothetical protein [Scytonema sp. PCC 10023]
MRLPYTECLALDFAKLMHSALPDITDDAIKHGDINHNPMTN